ncbi:hypothetical protein RGQ29_025080 [Quercus rubra]|uniref:Uncharacterized protein n=1 Tax=Quercus rubra TaxID=3512 RepID=A0AAN7EYU2_QUERU|nr:hypothetical protein RGQ29_025080 [Quercus rubra]
MSLLMHHIHQHNHQNQSHHCCFHSLLLQKKNTHQCYFQKTYQRIHCRVFHILVKTDHHHRCCCCFHSLLLQKKNTHQCYFQKTYQRIHCRVFHILVKTDHHHRCCCFHSLLLQMNHQKSLCRLIQGKTDHNFLYLFRWIHQKTYQTSHYCLLFSDERSQ